MAEQRSNSHEGSSAYEFFSMGAHWAAHQCGRPITFALAFLLVILWAASGPLFHYSDTWQLIINTSTTIVTFLMVFLLQHAQNKDSATIQIKLDELIRSNAAARNRLLSLEDLTEAEFDHLKKAFAALAKEDGKRGEGPRQAGRGLADLQGGDEKAQAAQ